SERAWFEPVDHEVSVHANQPPLAGGSEPGHPAIRLNLETICHVVHSCLREFHPKQVKNVPYLINPKDSARRTEIFGTPRQGVRMEGGGAVLRCTAPTSRGLRRCSLGLLFTAPGDGIILDLTHCVK